MSMCPYYVEYSMYIVMFCMQRLSILVKDSTNIEGDTLLEKTHLQVCCVLLCTRYGLGSLVRLNTNLVRV